MLIMHFVLPLVLIGPAIWGLSVNYVSRVETEYSKEWLPKSGQEGSLQCIYKNVIFWVDQDNMTFANITGNTVNSTLCTDMNIPYYQRYWDPVPGDKNDTRFKDSIKNLFPINQTINCSVFRDCSYFYVYQFPEYVYQYNWYALVWILAVITIGVIIILPILGIYYGRKKWISMRLSRLHENLLHSFQP